MKHTHRQWLWLIAVSGAVACKSKGPDDSGIDATPVAPWPEWAFSHWVWEDESTEESLWEMVDGYEAAGIPVGAVIIDSPWETGYNTLEWDTELFPDPEGMIEELHDREIRVFMWITAAINTDEEELYAEAADAGYFMQEDAESGPGVVSWWKGDGSLIDYFNPEAVEWWHGLLDPVLDMGIDGWKCDGLDYSQIFVPYSPGAGKDVDRLDYSHAYYQDFFDYTRERLGDDRIITARPIDNYGSDISGDLVAFAPVEITWAGWVGDQDPGFDGLKAALLNMYYSADYGYLAFGSDIGGYREDESLELGREVEPFIRWAQVGAFCPIMENGGSGEHWPWKFGDETTSIYKVFVDLHEAIRPYLMEQGAVAFEEGKSLMTFQSKETFAYLLGEDLFVAPIVQEDGVVSVTFPDEGDWVYLFDETLSYEAGSQADLTIPLDEFSVFVRSGSDLAQTLLEGD